MNENGFIPGWPWLDRPSVPRVVVVQLAREVWPGIVARDRDSPADAAREAFEYAEAFVKRAMEEKDNANS